MNILKSGVALAALAVCQTAVPTSATAAGSDILFVIDGSNSMWGQINSVAKIDTAKRTLASLIDDVPSTARVGLMTYGTTSKDSCTDYSFLNPIGAQRSEVKQSISGITPRGKTPIALALMAGITSLQKTEPTDTPKSIVLVSDGIETCNMDPCASARIAKTAALLGVDIKVHVVGFDLDADAKAQMQCIADAGGGQYFDAQNPEGFQTAMAQAVNTAQAIPQPAPVVEAATPVEPAGPTTTQVFRDDFDGDDLNAADWVISNANPDNYIVDGGELLLLSTQMGGLEAEQPENLITYTGGLPDGDWDATITFKAELNSIADRLSIGLRNDNENFVSAAFRSIDTGTGCLGTRMDMVRANRGETDAASVMHRTNQNYCYVRNQLGAEQWSAIKASVQDNPTQLTLSKRGREYFAKTVMPDVLTADGEPLTVTTQSFRSLRPPRELSFTVDRAPVKFDRTGEVVMMIDSFVINQVNE